MHIENLSIKNFKSIKAAELDCKDINVLIGPPNVGKSCFLEIFALLGGFFYPAVTELIRFQSTIDLYYNKETEKPIEIQIKEKNRSLATNIREKNQEITVNATVKAEKNQTQSSHVLGRIKKNKAFQRIDRNLDSWISYLKFYSFKKLENYQENEMNYLEPCYGNNFFSLLKNSPQFQEMISKILSEYDLHISLDTTTQEIRIYRSLGIIDTSFKYHLLSDTLQRYIFYKMAIESNKDSVLIFEEPESNSFPLYIKLLAEHIARFSETNQFFITTHNPYFLITLLSSAVKDNVNIFYTFMEDGQTQFILLNANQIEEIQALDSSAFLNLDNLIKNTAI